MKSESLAADSVVLSVSFLFSSLEGRISRKVPGALVLLEVKKAIR